MIALDTRLSLKVVAQVDSREETSLDSRIYSATSLARSSAVQWVVTRDAAVVEEPETISVTI
jgi:hypothetical protein